MNVLPEAAYWVTMAHLPNWRIHRINSLVVDILEKRKVSFADFFEADSAEWKRDLGITDPEAEALREAKAGLPNNSFLVENLYSQGIEIVPLNSPDYSRVLKGNLKMNSPTILYVKGNN